MKHVDVIERLKRIRKIYQNTIQDYTAVEVINRAIEAVEKQEADRWIPVTERLPEKDDFVLVTISGVTSNGKSWEHTMTLAVWTGDSWELVDADMADFRIFAWRPLPAPYQEDEA